MNDYSRDIILLLKENGFTQEHIDMQVQYIHRTISSVDTDEVFCKAHELVKRNRITAKKKYILRAIENEKLKPFIFLLNKN